MGGNLINETSATPAPLAPLSFDDSMQRSLAALEAETQALRQTLVAQEQSDKQTKPTYARHVTNYQTWWEQSQHAKQAEDATWTAVPAFPITVVKVALFLHYETTRPQVV